MKKIIFKKKKSTYHHGNLRFTLLAEAASIIKNEGLQKLSLRKLAKTCSVSSMALYRHFSNKDDLILAVVQQGYTLLQQKLNDIYQQYNNNDKDVISTLKALGHGYFDFAHEYQNFFYLMYGENIFPISAKEQLDKQSNTIFDFLKSILQKGMKDNKIINLDPNSIAFAVWSYLHGITSLFLHGKADDINTNLSSHQLIDQLMDYMYVGLNQHSKKITYAESLLH